MPCKNPHGLLFTTVECQAKISYIVSIYQLHLWYAAKDKTFLLSGYMSFGIYGPPYKVEYVHM